MASGLNTLAALLFDTNRREEAEVLYRRSIRIDEEKHGRDHHPRNFCMWLAGGGVKAGLTYGETDEYSYNVVENPVHVHDLQATILHLLGIDHERLTFKFQGRHYRLTDVHGHVVKGVLA